MACYATLNENGARSQLPNKISTAQTRSTSSDLNILYENAILDAADPQDNEVPNNLTVIDKSNQSLRWDKNRILVTTFTTKDKYPIGDFTSSKEIWVTVVPELNKFCNEYFNTLLNQAPLDLKLKQLNIRLKQLLGLPPDSAYTHIAVIWVDTQYLRRPSLDPEINDATVQTFPTQIKYPLAFSQGVDSAYKDWFTPLFQDRESNHYPFTGLGYTYDWAPKPNLQNDAGLSEFIILPNSPINVVDNPSTEMYCKKEN